MEAAREALRLAEAEPRRAAALADITLQAARSERDHATSAVALRARGLAAMHLEDLDTAAGHLRAAIAAGRRAGSATLVGEARMTLAWVLNWRGQPRAALRDIAAAISELDGVERARAQGQRGTILHQAGSHDEALREYNTALPILRRFDDLVWVQRILSNRGNLYTRMHQFSAAEADLLEAETICRGIGLDLSVGFVQHNLGFLYMLRGDVPAAVYYFDHAEQRLRGHGSQVASLLVDRSEVLLSARLIPDARAIAEQAVHANHAEGRGVMVPEARMLVAQAARLQGDGTAALHAAALAAREFSRLGETEWAALARMTVLTFRLEDAAIGAATPAHIDRTVAATARRWPDAELDLRIAAARRALQTGRPARAVALLDSATRRRRTGPATRRARVWYAEALRRQAVGRPAAAASAARAGLRLLDDHAAGLGATDLRAHAAAHRLELVRLGLGIAFGRGRPAAVFEWAELGRASHLQHPPVRPPDDPELAEALTELRMLVRDIGEQRGAGRVSPALAARQVGIERRIRDHHHRHRGLAQSRIARTDLRSLAAALGDAALAEFVEFEASLHVITIVDGRLRLRALGPIAAVRELVDRLPFALHRLARRHAAAASIEAGFTLLRDTAARLDELLIRACPEIEDRSLVIVPTGPLQWLPWSVLPSCAGRPLTVSPSAALWLGAEQRDASGGHIGVAAGPGLPGAKSEAASIAAIYGVAPLLGAQATTTAVKSMLDGATLVHLATHGTVRADNPLFSSLLFADGPLMVYDLERLKRAPQTVVLAACETGRSVAPVGDELLGVSATFLAQGSRQLVASVLPILDVETQPMMVALHRLIAAGEPVAVALAAAQQNVAAEGPAGVATAAGFLCFGSGFTRR